MRATRPGDHVKGLGLAVHDLYVTIPDGERSRTLLDHVDLDVRAGEVVYLTGDSGAGKSTLLAIAGLLRRPPTGEVVIAGRATSQLSPRQRTSVRRAHVGIIYQSANLIPSLTAREQLEVVGRIHRSEHRATRRRADQLLAELGLVSVADRLPARMSGGERQRVGIGRALMGEPTVLLADEPTASLDPERAAEVAALITERSRSLGLATVVVTHDQRNLTHADRHLHLDGGALRPMESVTR